MIFIETVTALMITFTIFFYFVFNIGSSSYFVKGWNSLYIFNPIRNYNTWTQFNWFGIAVMTLLLNVVFAPYAIVYWVYKLFTVGRKENK